MTSWPVSFFKTGRFLVLALLWVSCNFAGNEGEVRTLQINRVPVNDTSGTPIRWADSTLGSSGIDLKVSTDIENQFSGGDYTTIASVTHGPVELMMRQWNLAIVGRTFFTIPTTIVANKESSSLSSYNDGEMGIYMHNSWFSSVSSSALAITQFFGFRRNAGAPNEYIELAHADIIFNYRDFTFSTDASDPLSYDFHSVLIHELGHFVGLAHNETTSSTVMSPYLGISESARSLYAIDKTNLENNYTVSGSSSMIASGFFIQGQNDIPNEKEGEEIEGIFELRSDGKCHHKINGKEVLVH